MQTEMRPIGEIRPYEYNPRLNDAAVDAVVASIAGSGKKKGREVLAAPGPTADAVGYILTPLRG